MNAIETAIRMETDAIAFYEEASAKVKNIAGQRMFLAIAEDEKQHLYMLTALFNGLNISPEARSNPLNIRTVFEELKNEMMERVKATDDEMDAFKIAMDMEKAGVEFYKKAVSGAAASDEKLLFERLVREEEKHYAVFSNTYSFMKDTGNWFMWKEHSIVEGG